ncbi:uncharacterized protein L969DRAFT_96169 [Mixia osmundae IAM 14324]|uniref:Dynein heavy chain, cytoplasmic n=1 Tax=Mixia osmundae (strain CBS 9802 / IAM 14324 / JCM 22182 / KY 12970) TaxID=764103 RepID=G7E4R7_MIXOS|nr:uncharacterized protein L969DRAFT_96169 [Mixia osmundae IAM 14324]KEI37648.1 hypothetical protein L969DRAFT_96169 [Mixia osmundae IAM 14324]GAA97827.1 hypothetical protein E5Q_04506 [Mixia osmundae IAM 14324]
MAEAALDDGPSSTQAVSARSDLFDVAIFVQYLGKVLPLLLGSQADELEHLFRAQEATDQLRHFGSEPARLVVYLNKTWLREASEAAQDGRLIYQYTVSDTMAYSVNHVATLACIKRVPSIDTAQPLEAQLHFVNLFGPASASASAAETVVSSNGDAGVSVAATALLNPYESLHNLVHLAVAPYFDAYVSSRADPAKQAPTSGKAKDAEAKMGIPMTRKKFAELELSLLHLQQNVEIPEIHLVVNPVVRSAVESCRTKGVAVSSDALSPTLLQDSGFLNRIQSDVNAWIKEIQNVTRLNRDVTSGSASQEINFWLSMERALEDIENQLKSDPVTLTLDILKHAKRFHATVSFIADTGLKEATDLVIKYNLLMKDFPLDELLSAIDLPRIEEALKLIFGHINKKLRVSPYPIRRALPLVEAISQDLQDQLIRVLGNQRLMQLDYDAFDRQMRAATAVFNTWDDLLKEFTNVAREVTRKRSEKFIPIKIVSVHTKFQERIAYLRQFRKEHTELIAMTRNFSASNEVRRLTGRPAERLNGSSDIDMEDEVRSAYDAVKNVDVLDISPEGTDIWISAEAAYNEQVSRVENSIIAKLRDRLGQTRNANQMFRIFKSFNTLFVRPKIRGAIQDHQAQLLDSVKDDLRRLQEKFKTSYRQSEVQALAQLRDLPPIGGAILWARQIERQLNAYMTRVEDVLGKGWELYAEGQKLQTESLSFRRKLDARPLYEAWLHEINRRDLQISGRLFEVVRLRTQDSSSLALAVSFDAHIISLFKEVRNLLWLGYSVPHQISNTAKDAHRVYPFAVSLTENIRTLAQTNELIHANPAVAVLLAEQRNKVQMLITKGLSLRWENFVNSYVANNAEARESRHAAFVREFSRAVSLLQERTESLVRLQEQVDAALSQLTSCDYAFEAFQSILVKLQQLVDRLNLEGFVNLDAYVAQLDAHIERKLQDRLQNVLEHWTEDFAKENIDGYQPLGNGVSVHGKGEALPTFQHELRIQNQVIFLEPPLAAARVHCYAHLQEQMAVVCALNRVTTSRYDMGSQLDDHTPQTLRYTALMSQLPKAGILRAFALIETRMTEMKAYVGKWLSFQALWDLESEHVYAELGDSIDAWQQMLAEIRRTRATFDTTNTSRAFGPLSIVYDQVQSKVSLKYDTWQRDILAKFGLKLGSNMRATHNEILQARKSIETKELDGSSTASAVAFITSVQDLRQSAQSWRASVDGFGNAQRTLERQRFTFPPDWLFIDQVEADWNALNDLLERKNAQIVGQIGGLRLKVAAEDAALANRVAALMADWEQEKPVQGNAQPEAAMTYLQAFEARLGSAQDELDLIARAKRALDVHAVEDVRLKPVAEELRDLKTVWTALSGIWAQLSELAETSWTSLQPRKLRQRLDALLASAREMPSRMRQYAAYEHVQDHIRQLIKINTLVTELRSEAMRERHWRQLHGRLNTGATLDLTGMTLATVWGLNLRRNETLIKEIIAQAQGEMALEEFLRQVRETWNSYTLDLVQYQTKTRLIRGWDDLFAKCSEHLNSLSAMKLSPYHKVFEDDAGAWEDKLNRIHLLFDIWIDVQRQWVYLEGIFTGSADIKHLLPVESSRFNMINTEFLTIMKKVAKSPLVTDVLAIPSVQKSMERLADLLSKIQKALGEYLERERSAFPRYYFVGDEDLLEIIGNSKDVPRIMKHLRKMFAGIASIVLDRAESRIEAMVSREGETIPFTSHIVFKDFPKINDWLAKLESTMRVSLAEQLLTAHHALSMFFNSPDGLNREQLLQWADATPAQLVTVAVQIQWTRGVEDVLRAGAPLQGCLDQILHTLDVLADAVLLDLQPHLRTKCEHLITEMVHQRDVVRQLIAQRVHSILDFAWQYHLRFYYDANVSEPLDRLIVRMSSAEFTYGYEYLGIADKLVQTPLTDRCYLTLTQALSQKLGGAPFGPAGTGKTESVKALGAQLGRFVLVFCCDETFDFQAMGRIFLGLCQVGAWACLDEMNRLEERILSAVSQQIQSIQTGLRGSIQAKPAAIELLGRRLTLKPETAVFITTNPGYAGRSNLPANLKKLFRSIAMTHPDRERIAQVMLFSQGFRTAEALASKIVPFFVLCSEQLSTQPHYDFGLRALKYVLVSAGRVKRAAVRAGDVSTTNSAEESILIQSVTETIMPKLVAEDVDLLRQLLADVFPGSQSLPADLSELTEAIRAICSADNLMITEQWLEKAIQLYQISQISHGIMLVGAAATGKSKVWQVLLRALEQTEGMEGVSYVIDPKAISKEALYGTLDPTTREWTDGLFTHILRRIIDNVRGEDTRRHWIVFDGDVDPEWVENLNSVLDDNKLLTLPNGERLNLPGNVRIIFEVESLRYATLATVSRCGMIWFTEGIVSPAMLLNSYLAGLAKHSLAVADEDDAPSTEAAARLRDSTVLQVQTSIAAVLSPFFGASGIVLSALQKAKEIAHIMEFTSSRGLSTLFSLLNKSVRNVHNYNASHSDFPLTAAQIAAYLRRRLLTALVWSFSGDSSLISRAAMSAFLSTEASSDMPDMLSGEALLDFDVDMNSGQWTRWQSQVPVIEIETHAVLRPDVVIPTIDTVRHEDVMYSWLSEHKPLMLCGPPGSGKTMTLFSALRKLPELEVAGLNFSSATSPELILKTFEQYCEYRKTPKGTILSPVQLGRWLVIFCDEINLPALDKYGTQRVISFMRQLVEANGFWRTSDKTWISLERIQFVGACNPPTDPGRVTMSQRFLRHAPLVMVDYPGEISLKQIYGTFNRASLKTMPTLRGYAEPLTAAMVEVYLKSQARFTSDVQAHYIYSPREMTRWMRGIYEAIRPLETLNLDGLVRLWAHEALRLFQDRLVDEPERIWTDELIDDVAEKHFPGIRDSSALMRPILYSNWTSRNYIPVERNELREFTKARLRVFYEEELDVPLVLFNDVLDHVLRIDRVFRQTQGHVLLIGISGSGKTTLSRFVAWMNGLSVFQVSVHNRYTSEDFDNDLRHVLRRSGCRSEKICFIMDESNVLDPGFLERMNTLLANAEVPGLFEGDEYAALMTACKEAAQRDGLILDSNDELYRWFTQQIAQNLHVVFTMNPPAGGLASRAATSPALFNRCVLDWLGDWSTQALYQVGFDFSNSLDLDKPTYAPPPDLPIAYKDLEIPPTHRAALVNAMVAIHQSMHALAHKVQRRQGVSVYITPRHYLDFVNHYVNLYSEKRDNLADQQQHLNVGLDKLRSTLTQVAEMRELLAITRAELKAKNEEANAKLQTMIADQREAEQQKAASITLQGQLERQNIDIASRKGAVMSELAEAEPAVEEAQLAVSNIKKQQLTEVRSMTNPPEAVKMAMESVCMALGSKADSWKTVQSFIRRDDFIKSIIDFDTDKRMTASLRLQLEREYLSRPGYTFELVDRASKACGPLVKWLIAQVAYSSILDRVGPLREEVDALEEQAIQTEAQAVSILGTVAALEASITRYKEEYAVLISETQALKTEMDRVESKVGRSIGLLGSLESERQRWEHSSATFDAQMHTMAGDTLLSAAFLAYAGYFDQSHRQSLWRIWARQLEDSAIAFKQDLSLTEFLSTADERLQWQANGLPSDDLCIENAVIISRARRYPLVIDPTGQAASFLRQQYASKRLTITSFLDASFTKSLETALRFGTALLIQDVERLDPIVNTVLNKELRRAGGRVLIRVGGQDIDFSPAFSLFLTTRDSSVEYAPDIQSRVTFINFTMTRESLQSQSLSRVMLAERPDTDSKRRDLIKLQGEYVLRLRSLERALLKALNDSQGNILDDDKVLATLETLKREAADVAMKVADADAVLQEVNSITAEYLPLAQACSSIFFMLERLSQLNHFYRFSLTFFLAIFERVLASVATTGASQIPEERLRIIADTLFSEVFAQASRSVLDADRLVLALHLASIKLRTQRQSDVTVSIDVLLHPADVNSPVKTVAGELEVAWLSHQQQAAFAELLAQPSWQDVRDSFSKHSAEWQSVLSGSDPERAWTQLVPKVMHQTTEAAEAARSLLLMRALRPDRTLPAAFSLAAAVFGSGLLSDHGARLASLVSEQAAIIPICIVSVVGYDATFRIDALAESEGIQCVSIAMGSQDGFARAEAAMSNAARQGNWVLLRNTHLCPAWLSGITAKLLVMQPTASFRLFLSMEITTTIPINLLSQSRVLMYEAPPGIRASLLDTLSSIPSKYLGGPAEEARIIFQLAWAHAVIVERVRYCPLGWTKGFEYNDSDFEASLFAIHEWIRRVAQNRSNIDPAQMPFQAIRTLFKQATYGGRIDTRQDQALLDTIVDGCFSAACFEESYALVQGQTQLRAPDGLKLTDYIAWAEALPEREPPSWLGLADSAQKLVAIDQGNRLVASLRRVAAHEDDDNDDDDSSLETTAQTPDALKPAWMTSIERLVTRFLNSLPASVEGRSNDSLRGPLARFWQQEQQLLVTLLDTVRSDLGQLLSICRGQSKQNNVTRQLASELSKDVIPPRWARYRSVKAMTVQSWIDDLAARITHHMTASDPSQKMAVQLGLLTNPNGLLVALRQETARSLRVSLESLSMSMQLGRATGSGLQVSHLQLHGADWTPAHLVANDGEASLLDVTTLAWLRADDVKTYATCYDCPVYLNADRDETLFVIGLPASDPAQLTMRSVCIIP